MLPCVQLAYCLSAAVLVLLKAAVQHWQILTCKHQKRQGTSHTKPWYGTARCTCQLHCKAFAEEGCQVKTHRITANLLFYAFNESPFWALGTSSTGLPMKDIRFKPVMTMCVCISSDLGCAGDCYQAQRMQAATHASTERQQHHAGPHAQRLHTTGL